MNDQPRRSGFTRVELVVVLLILGIALAVLIPWIQQRREMARRSECLNNLKQIGLSLHNFHESQKKLPAAATMIVDSAGKYQAPSWSFLVRCQPFTEYSGLYDTLIVNPGTLPEDNTSKSAFSVRNTLISEFTCPSNPNPVYQDPVAKTFALTNYKAMGASHLGSLGAVLTKMQYTPAQAEAPQYRGNHPDGAMYPNSQTRFADFGDGSAHTILVTETIEPNWAVWTYGRHACVYGLNPPTPLICFPTVSMINGNYYAPVGFNGQYGKKGGINRTLVKATIGCDYSRAPDAGTYIDTFLGTAGKSECTYGPSSGHPSVVNHLFGDGAVRSLNKDVDPAAYFFGCTRNGGDPTPPWFSQ